MSERKVINKYFPPDFDPSKIGRRKGPKNSQHKVRLMAPFSMNCRTCGNWIAKSTKFNARKENVKDMDYLGIRIFRFYIRCPRCSAEITFRTDPQNTDYVCEQGAVRNFEPWKDSSLTEDELKEQRAKDEENNPMKALENRTMESKREMDILDALDEIRTRNAMNERVDPEGLLEKLMEKKRKDTEEAYAVLLEQLLDEEDDAYARSIFGGGSSVGEAPDEAPAAAVKRLAPDEEDSDDEAVLSRLRSKFGGGDIGPMAASNGHSSTKPANGPRAAQTLVVAKKQKTDLGVVPAKANARAQQEPAKSAPPPSALSGLAVYDDSDGDSASGS